MRTSKSFADLLVLFLFLLPKSCVDIEAGDYSDPIYLQRFGMVAELAN
jgi:hypothetical protein